MSDDPRCLELLARFWAGSRMSPSELAELDSLYRSNMGHVWSMTAAKEEESK